MTTEGNLYQANLSQTISEIDSFTQDRYKQFTDYFEPNLSVLDIGCNTGRGGGVIKSIFPSNKVYGIDLVSERISKIQPGIYEYVFNESITRWDGAGLKFDRIIAGELIEHIPSEEFVVMLNQCSRFLKIGGLILFTTPNPNSLLVKLGRNAVFNDPSHVNIMSIKKFKGIIQQSDLKIKKILGSGKSTRYIGSKIPILFLYGSYLAILTK